jgi:S-adenosylmethionine:tRNA ribosyltransferase-isomerase
LRIDDFDYTLPPGAIAQEALPDRASSRLMVLDHAGAEVRHRVFRDLPELLSPGDLLVVNRTRVFPARLLGQREGGGKAEVLLIRPLGGDVWEALVRPGRRLRAGTRVIVAEDLALRIESGASRDDSARRRVRLECVGDPAVVLERRGHTPLPPYIRRPDRPEDRERYQTVYARETGSVAAPTAGLHFTPELLTALEARGVERAEVVLHVRPGTFRPVQAAQVEDHRVEPEPYRVPGETVAAIRRARARGGRVVAVGTTTVRALESAAAREGEVIESEGETELVILPGFRFQVVDALLTNFHLPRSSLLLLVCALGGRERVLAAYGEAVRAGYRFYSYGDAMLIV